MSGSGRRYGTLLAIFAAVLAVWGIVYFFEDAYFGALFYGVPVPSWAAWVGNLPIWTFNAIDTVIVAILFASLIVAYLAGRPKRRVRGTRGVGSVTYGVGGWLVLLVAFVLLFAFLYANGITLADLVSGVRGFFGA